MICDSQSIQFPPITIYRPAVAAKDTRIFMTTSSHDSREAVSKSPHTQRPTVHIARAPVVAHKQHDCGSTYNVALPYSKRKEDLITFQNDVLTHISEPLAIDWADIIFVKYRLSVLDVGGGSNGRPWNSIYALPLFPNKAPVPNKHPLASVCDVQTNDTLCGTRYIRT